MKNRKILSVLLAVCMVLSLMPTGLVGAFALGEENDPVALALGQNTLGFADTEEVYCEFTPEEEGVYLFASFSEFDPAIFLYAPGGDLIASADNLQYEDYLVYDFDLLASLEADVTYTVKVTADPDSMLAPEGFSISTDLQLNVEKLDADPFFEGDNMFTYGGYYYFIPEESGIYLFSCINCGAEFYDETENQVGIAGDEGIIALSLKAGQVCGLYAMVSNSEYEAEICIDLVPSLATGKNRAEVTEPGAEIPMYYSFTAEESGVYTFSSCSDYDPYVNLYSLQFEDIAWGDDGGNEYSANGYDFYLSYHMEAGESYLLAFGDYEGIAPYDVYVDAADATEIFLGDNEIGRDETVLYFESEADGYYSFVMNTGVDAECVSRYSHYSREENDYTLRFATYLEAGSVCTLRLTYYDQPEEELNMVVSYSDEAYYLSCENSISQFISYYGEEDEPILEGDTVYFGLSNSYTYSDLALTVEGTDETCEFTAKEFTRFTVYSFVMPAGNVTVRATPVLKDYTVSVSTNDGIAYVETVGNANAGDTVRFTVTLNDALYEITGISVTYDNNGTPAEVQYQDGGDYYSFIMPAGNVTITPTFKKVSLENVPALTLGDNIIASDAGPMGLFSFTPEESGRYMFSSVIAEDPFAILYSDSLSKIAENDDGGAGYNFKITSQLTAGKTYYLSIVDYDDKSIAGTVTIERLPDVEVLSHAVVLSGEIGAIFNVYINEDNIDLTDSYVEFNVGKAGTQWMFTENVEPENEDDVTYYPFVCFVGAYRMADEITPVFHYFDGDEEKTVELEPYSVEDYLNFVIENSYNYPDELIPVIEAINDYGYYSQQYLSTLHGFTLGDGGKYAAMSSVYTQGYNYDYVKSNLQNYDYDLYSVTKSEDYVEKVSFSLDLESEISMYLYITVKDGVVPDVAYVPGYEDSVFPITQCSDNVYRVTVSGLNMYLVDTYYDIIVEDTEGNELVNASISPLNYVYLVLDRYGDDAEKAELCEVVCAFEECYQAIREYIDNPPEIPMP